MEHFMGEGWHLRPAGGATGEAYIAEQGQQKIFIKRNSSPFLAVLSAEGIVPKLLWTKRLENGDVITAQQWVNGRELKSGEMNCGQVAGLLAKIHRSEELLDMFMRMGNKPLDPGKIYEGLSERASGIQETDGLIAEALEELSSRYPLLPEGEYVVCHTDVHHNNWIEDENKNLFLIDWDGAQVADPALDLAPLLYEYVPKKDWDAWLAAYGENPDGALLFRMWWYRMAQCVENVLWHMLREEKEEVSAWYRRLEEVRNG
nr:phosphotransferase family protein [Alkalicoccus saliphilus]